MTRREEKKKQKQKQRESQRESRKTAYRGRYRFRVENPDQDDPVYIRWAIELAAYRDGQIGRTFFSNGLGKVVILTSESLARAMLIRLYEQIRTDTDTSVIAKLTKSLPPPAMVCLNSQQWEEVKERSGGQYVECDSVEDFKKQEESLSQRFNITVSQLRGGRPVTAFHGKRPSFCLPPSHNPDSQTPRSEQE